MVSKSNESLNPSQEQTSAPALICFSHLRWDFVTQRPQHLMSRAALEQHVFFWEEPVWHHPESPTEDRAELIKFLERRIGSEGVVVLRPHLSWGIDFEEGQRDLLNSFLRDEKLVRFDLWYYTPMALVFSNHLKPEVLIFDCMDELSAFDYCPPLLSQREEELIAKTDVLFTGGRSLNEAKSPRHTNVHCLPSSIEQGHFASAIHGGLTDPADQQHIPHPRVGFYGVVDERFDTSLLSEVVSMRPETHFIIVGPIVKVDASRLPAAANIHYLGSKSYEELPSYLAGWDVAMMPFALNKATRYISPTKTPEYLAAGKSVVSTPIHDVVSDYGDRGLVVIAKTASEFASAIDLAAQPQTMAWKIAVAQALATTSWDITWKAMRNEIERARAKGRRASTNSFAAERSEPTAHIPHTTPRYKLGNVYDYLVVGAGFAGCVIAERLASQLGKRVFIVDKRDHIGGNAYDHYNEHGILVHKYGPHIFHTNCQPVVDYLSQFTEWRPYEHRVLASVNSILVPLPINLDTINSLYETKFDADGMRSFLASRTEVHAEIRTSEHIVLSRVGRELYELFFRNYTRKQWGLDPSDLDASVAGRIPVRYDRDDRYFTDTFQAMPLKGYTHMFERMLDNPLITIGTETNYDEALAIAPRANVVYTGPIDEYFDFRFGPLPYRSLEFVHETHDTERHQKAPVINHPNAFEFTRVTEFKYLTGQRHNKTSIVYEYPRAEGEPYYPIPRPANAALYERYLGLARGLKGVHFCGRLATYRYLNMDQVVAQALTTFRAIAYQDRSKQSIRPKSTLRDSKKALAGD